MWNRIKWFLAAIGGLLAWVFYLLQRNKGLQGELSREKQDEETKAFLDALSEAKKDAEAKEEEYRRARDAFKREHGDGE